jgi:hypothetical protein
MFNLLQMLLAVGAAAVIAFGGGALWGIGHEEEQNKAERDAALIKAMQDKAAAEESERNTKRELGNLYANRKSGNDSSAAGIDTRLRVTVCKPGRLPETPSAGPSPNGTGESGRLDSRTVDLEPITRRIVELGRDLDNCAAKVDLLQRGQPGYTVGNESP